VSDAQWFLLASLALFAAASLRVMHQVASGGRPVNLDAPRGSSSKGVAYSLTGAMLPWKKESARLHAAVYILGVAYHGGTILGFFWLVVLFFRAGLPPVAASVSVALLALTALAGLVLLVRRISKANLRHFSSPDDYFGNILVTGFQALTAVVLADAAPAGALFVYAGVLLVYIPFGKLRHALYFGLARYYLGLFYGRRGVWSGESGRTWRSQKP
jgi:nitrate reductase gamma subunit